MPGCTDRSVGSELLHSNTSLSQAARDDLAREQRARSIRNDRTAGGAQGAEAQIEAEQVKMKRVLVGGQLR